MPRRQAPEVVQELADARAGARRARDWATADALLVQIRDAGWKVVDVGTLYDLEPLAAADETVGGVVRYGSSTTVPSRLNDGPTSIATVVLLATDRPPDLARTLRSVVGHAPDGTQVVVVANRPSEAQAADLEQLEASLAADTQVSLEVVWLSARLGRAAALNAGIRRAVAPVVILLDTNVEPEGDLVSPLVTALEDEAVAVAGLPGLVSSDMRRFVETAAATTGDAPAVDAIGDDVLAFRRRDYLERGPLDEHFIVPEGLAVWWSLVLRDASDEEVPPRRAVRVDGVSMVRHAGEVGGELTEFQRERAAKKNAYRILKRFATRRDLLGNAGDDRPA